MSRRVLLAGITGAVATNALPAFAMSRAEAIKYVEETVEEIRKILTAAAGAPIAPKDLRRVMVARSNMAQIARFCAGRSWRDMSGDQQNRYVDAFSHYISVTYARRFNDFSGTPTITIGRTTDAGRKGYLVESPIQMPDGKRYMVEWLVSDRGGAVEIVDLVIERVSMAATQREEIGVMLDRRGGNVDELIKALNET